MDDLFNDLKNEIKCQKNGVCSQNPILRAIDAALINEIRQIAFYTVKLKELNFINPEIMKKAITALSVCVSDTSYDKKSLISFWKSLYGTKKEIKEFYIKKSKELNSSIELVFQTEDKEAKSATDLIKIGEEIINGFYNKLKERKIRLIHLIILSTKMSAVNLIKLSNYKNVSEKYYFEILRLVSLLGDAGIREEKLARRLKEFSEISFNIEEELDFEREKAYGKRTNSTVRTDIFKGKSILVTGGDFFELHKLLKECEGKDINIYTDPSFAICFSYPEFMRFENLKGIFSKGSTEYDFSSFKGVIFITESSCKSLDGAIRGKIFTTKEIPSDRAQKLNKENFAPLIEEAKKAEGFENEVKGKTYEIKYDQKEIKDITDKNENEHFLISLGKNCAKIKQNNEEEINFPIPYESQGVHFVFHNVKKENLSICFSDCSPNSINTLIGFLNKGIKKIYLHTCSNSNLNPHIIESLIKDFKVEII